MTTNNITVSVNGDLLKIPTATSLLDAMAQWQFTDAKCAVAINGEFIPRATYENTTLNDGDEVDIVAPVGGG